MTATISVFASDSVAAKSLLLCNATTEMMKPIERTITTKGSTLSPGDSSVYSPVPHVSIPSNRSPAQRRYVTCVENGCGHVLNMVLLLPPAPAALVLAGRALAILSALSAAAFLLIAVAGPPGALGEAARAVVEPVVGLELIGDEGRGED